MTLQSMLVKIVGNQRIAKKEIQATAGA